MEISLGKRLGAIADLVGRENVIADIGCDHGLIANYLVENGQAQHVYATDVSKASLDKNIEFTRFRGNQSRVDSLLGDGLAPIRNKDFDALIIAGMGGELITRILEEDREILEGKVLILQAMTGRIYLRKSLERLGISILKEVIVKENDIYYEIIRAKSGPGSPRKHGYEFGENLIKEKDPLLIEMIESRRAKLKTIEFKIEANSNSRSQDRLIEVRERIKFYERILNGIKG